MFTFLLMDIVFILLWSLLLFNVGLSLSEPKDWSISLYFFMQVGNLHKDTIYKHNVLQLCPDLSLG